MRRTLPCAAHCAHFAVRRTVHGAHTMLTTVRVFQPSPPGLLVGPPSGPVRDGTVFLATPATALLCPLAESPRFRPAWAKLVAPVVRTLGCSWLPFAPAVSVLAAAPRPSVAPAVSNWNYAARRMSAPPEVSTRCGSQAFSRAKDQYPPLGSSSGLVTFPGSYCTVVSESGRAKIE